MVSARRLIGLCLPGFSGRIKSHARPHARSDTTRSSNAKPFPTGETREPDCPHIQGAVESRVACDEHDLRDVNPVLEKLVSFTTPQTAGTVQRLPVCTEPEPHQIGQRVWTRSLDV